MKQVGERPKVKVYHHRRSEVKVYHQCTNLHMNRHSRQTLHHWTVGFILWWQKNPVTNIFLIGDHCGVLPHSLRPIDCPREINHTNCSPQSSFGPSVHTCRYLVASTPSIWRRLRGNRRHHPWRYHTNSSSVPPT